MITVIIAGGSGTRLWPLSTPDYPKHLLNILGDESLLQATYGRAKHISDKIYVMTEASHAKFVREQLPELTSETCIVEPARRGTANCIIAVLHHLQSRHDADEPIAFLHADHSIRDLEGFAYTFKTASEAASEQKRLTLIGIEPTYASTGLGYIQKDGKLVDDALVYNVQGFTEKPDFDTAQDYVKSGRYLWNCGYFVGSLNIFLAAFQQFSPQWKGYYDQLLEAPDENAYKEAYLTFENKAIDYALLEFMDNLLVVPASFDWMDLGTFKDAHKAVKTNEAGNYVHGEKVELIEVENSFIRNDEPTKPVAVIGLDNVVVINTPKGVLVVRKDLAQRVGEVAKKIQQR